VGIIDQENGLSALGGFVSQKLTQSKRQSIDVVAGALDLTGSGKVCQQSGIGEGRIYAGQNSSAFGIDARLIGVEKSRFSRSGWAGQDDYTLALVNTLDEAIPCRSVALAPI
jgi:hypothetical protein